MAPIRHGHNTRSGGQSPTYRSWASAARRCSNPNTADWARYGGRGIRVCDRWLAPGGQGFVNFLADMGERPEGMSLDRVDSDGDYSPENCRWATATEQALNRSRRGPFELNPRGPLGTFLPKPA